MEENQFPSVGEQASNLTDLMMNIASDTINGKRIFTSLKEQQYRMEICKTCEFYDEESNRCKECGCYLKQKVKIAGAWCPIFKWDRVN